MMLLVFLETPDKLYSLVFKMTTSAFLKFTRLSSLRLFFSHTLYIYVSRFLSLTQSGSLSLSLSLSLLCFSLQQLLPCRKGTVCVQQCEEGEYVTNEGQCSRCSPSCETCDSLTKCSSCSSGMFLNPRNFTCDTSCPNNMLAKGT